ncbi:MAG TPA: hypothetical protein VJ378_01815 [Candidatus Paceibacterota bacterium]|nr:hypothetical protein [Candidatus Paceibacterota bacterium]
MNINVHEAKKVCGMGIISLPCHKARPSGCVDKDKNPNQGDKITLPSGRVIPWVPANKIGW